MAFPVIRDKHKITRGYSTFHKAIDIAPKVRGTSEPVAAVGAGVISHVDAGGWRAGNNFILRLDGDNSLWWYTHLKTIGGIRLGQRFADGQALLGALTGNTGNSFGVHLHLVRFADGILDNFTDPWPYIRNAADPFQVSAPPKPPVSKPSTPRRARMRLTNWVVYKDGRLREYLRVVDGRPEKWTGTYEVLERNNLGHYRIRGGDGRTAWVHSLAKAGII